MRLPRSEPLCFHFSHRDVIFEVFTAILTQPDRREWRESFASGCHTTRNLDCYFCLEWTQPWKRFLLSLKRVLVLAKQTPKRLEVVEWASTRSSVSYANEDHNTLISSTSDDEFSPRCWSTTPDQWQVVYTTYHYISLVSYLSYLGCTTSPSGFQITSEWKFLVHMKCVACYKR